MPPEDYKCPFKETIVNDRIGILEARLKEIRAIQAFKQQYPNASIGEVESFKMGYKAAFN